MADASYNQSNFLGGEWSGFADGRIDLPAYKTALKVSLNMLPMEEGAATRRSGSRRLGMTAYGASGIVDTFWLPNHLSVICEATYSNMLQKSHLRFWTQEYVGEECDDLRPLCDAFVLIASLSQTVPVILTLQSAPPSPSMNGNTGWQTGDQVVIYIDPSVPLANGPIYINRQFEIVALSDTQFALYYRDQTTNVLVPFDGTQLGAGIAQYGNSFAGHVVQFVAPWKSLAEVKALRLVQAGGACAPCVEPAYFLSALTPPWALTLITPAPGALPNAPWFTFAAADLVDGPYLDPLDGNSQTGNSIGQINLSPGPGLSSLTIMDGAYAFQPTDVGRPIRLWWQPKQWSGAMALTYNAAQASIGTATPLFVTRCTYNGSYWVQNVPDEFAVGAPPGTVKSTTAIGGGAPALNEIWTPLPPTAAFWLFGIIASISTLNSPNDTAEITFDDVQQNLIWNDLQPSQYNVAAGAQIDAWQLGVFTQTQSGKLAGGYPTNGFFHQGRLGLMGAVPNRLDLSVPLGLATTPPYGPGPNGFDQIQTSGANSGTPVLAIIPAQWPPGVSPYYIGITPNLGSYSSPCFSPTVSQGADVLDSNAIAISINAATENHLLWGRPLHDGVVLGTIGGEYLLTGGPGGLTPGNAVVHRATRYGGKFVDPLNVGQALIFVQALGTRVMEYIIDAFNLQRLTGRHLNEYAKHLTRTGVVKIAYQEERIPVIWACLASATDGQSWLVGCTYRRMGAAFGDTPPQMMGWHRHVLGNGRQVASITTGSNQTGTLDQLVMLTTDGVDF